MRRLDSNTHTQAATSIAPGNALAHAPWKPMVSANRAWACQARVIGSTISVVHRIAKPLSGNDFMNARRTARWSVRRSAAILAAVNRSVRRFAAAAFCVASRCWASAARSARFCSASAIRSARRTEA